MSSRFLLICFAVLLLPGCRSRVPDPPPVPVVPMQATLIAVGDILMHSDVKKSAAQNGGFDALWAEVTPLFRSRDVVFGNLETPIAPTTGQPGVAFRFNAPAELPEALQRSGFTILSAANNHAYDQGTSGLLETLSRLERAGLSFVGSGADQPQAMTPVMVERNGIHIAFLAWTDLFNIQLNRVGKGPWVNGLDGDQACEAVRAARMKADVVVVSIHWGVEDQHEPTPRQRELASRLFEAGADLILGHHPHVLQPLEISESGGRKVAVAYSLGNFISNQNRIYDAERMPTDQGDARDEAAVTATFIRKAPDRVELDAVSYIPLWTENNWWQINRGETKQRDIRVVRLDVPERQTQPWIQRRERIKEIMDQSPEALTQEGRWGLLPDRMFR